MDLYSKSKSLWTWFQKRIKYDNSMGDYNSLPMLFICEKELDGEFKEWFEKQDAYKKTKKK